MSSVTRKAELWKSRSSLERIAAEVWTYPTGMVWCPMKMSGIAIMKCAELQKELGCGSLRQFRIITTTKPGNVPFFWPWLRRGRECPERANDKDVRELRLALSPLRSVEKSGKNPRAYRCPACGGRKAFRARQCRRCWRVSVEKLTKQLSEEELRSHLARAEKGVGRRRDSVCYERGYRRQGWKRCFTNDEGWSLEVGVQAQTSNHRKRHGLRFFVMNVAGKGGAVLRQVKINKTNASEPNIRVTEELKVHSFKV